MNFEAMNNTKMYFFDKAMENERSQLLSIMADAVSECRIGADDGSELSYEGQMGLLRLAEICCTVKARLGKGGLILEGTAPEILADIMAQLYSCITQSDFDDLAGMAVYVELRYMMEEIMDGEWFE